MNTTTIITLDVDNTDRHAGAPLLPEQIRVSKGQFTATYEGMGGATYASLDELLEDHQVDVEALEGAKVVVEGSDEDSDEGRAFVREGELWCGWDSCVQTPLCLVPPEPGFLCVSDRYTEQAEVFMSLDEFGTMCRACFNEVPKLTRVGEDYHDDQGIVLRAL